MGGGSSKSKDKNKTTNNSRVTEQDKAILQLKQMRDKLKQYRIRIETKLGNEREIAKELIKNKQIEKAKLLLKKKKFYEDNIYKTDQNLDNIDQLIHTLEYTQIEQQVVNSLKIGNDCLKKLHEMLSIDQIEDILDDTRDAIEHQQKIDQLLGNELSEESLDEINNELDDIIKSTLPQIPNHSIKIDNYTNDTIEGEKKVKEKETKKKIAELA